MHINDFAGLQGYELCKIQEEIFTAFFQDNLLDIGFGPLRAVHVKAAIYLAEQHANAKGLKKYFKAKPSKR